MFRSKVVQKSFWSAVCVLGCLSSLAHAGYEEGKAAFERGEYATALQELAPLAEKGHINAQIYLGAMYLGGKGVTRSVEEASKWFHKAAAQDNPVAMCNLATLYIMEKPNDFQSGYVWAIRSADAGDYECLVIIGQAYENGWGVTQNFEEAVKWYRKFAEKGAAKGQSFLADMYLFGRGVTRNVEEAAKLYRSAADQGYADAQWRLGDFYRDGSVVQKDVQEAMKWYQKAAEQGHARAQALVGAGYFTGEGVSKNYEEAAKWLRKAAEQGDSMGQGMLGIAYRSGLGVPHDNVQAFVWLCLSAAQRDENSKKLLQNMLEKRILSPAQLEQAKTRLREHGVELAD